MTTAIRVASPADFDRYGPYGVKSRPAADGGFQRAPYPFRGRITADGSSGFAAEPGRYHLYVSWACPWAHRSAIVRALVGLEDVVSMSVVDPIRDGRGWAFRDGPGHGPDPVNGFTLLRQAYEATEPGYDGHVSVPLLWDKATGRIVSNNFPDISIDLGTRFREWAADPGVDLYPEGLRTQIDELNERVYTDDINTGSTGAASRRRRRRTTGPSSRCSPASTKPAWLIAATCSASRSPKPTCGCGSRSCVSTPCTSPTSRRTCGGWSTTRSCGPTPATSTASPPSVARRTSTTSSATTT